MGWQGFNLASPTRWASAGSVHALASVVDFIVIAVFCLFCLGAALMSVALGNCCALSPQYCVSACVAFCCCLIMCFVRVVCLPATGGFTAPSIAIFLRFGSAAPSLPLPLSGIMDVVASRLLSAAPPPLLPFSRVHLVGVRLIAALLRCFISPNTRWLQSWDRMVREIHVDCCLNTGAFRGFPGSAVCAG